MTSRQENNLSMYKIIDAYLNANSEIVNKLPYYSEISTVFTEGIKQIKNLWEKQTANKTGITKRKLKLKLNLAIEAANTSSKLQAYASLTNNLVLLSEIKFTESELKKARDNDLSEYSLGIYNRAQTHISELAPYGITVDTQSAFLTLINSFSDSIPSSRLSIASRKQFTAQLVEAFKITHDALHKIDMLVEIVKQTETSFYRQYKSARKIVKRGNRSFALKGKVLDAMSKKPVRYARIIITMKENDTTNVLLNNNGSITKKSARKGGFVVKSMPGGIYTIEISKNGYITQQKTIVVNKGELTRIIIELEKN